MPSSPAKAGSAKALRIAQLRPWVRTTIGRRVSREPGPRSGQDRPAGRSSFSRLPDPFEQVSRLVERPWAAETTAEADALVTGARVLSLAITTADCVPVLFADAGGRGGRRGPRRLARCARWRLVEQRWSAMEPRRRRRVEPASSPRSDPAIEQRPTKSVPEFPAPFLEQSADNARLLQARGARWAFHVRYQRLCRQPAGGRLNCRQRRILPQDTCGEPDLFFSYRRSCHNGEEIDYGRQPFGHSSGALNQMADPLYSRGTGRKARAPAP